MNNRVKEMRFNNGELTQQDLAKLVEVSRQTIISIEKGKFNPSVKLALQIAAVFHKNVNEIFYLEAE